MPCESSDQYYIRTIFKSFIDNFKNQLIERFCKYNEIVSISQKMTPSILDKFKPNDNNFKKCIDFYKHIIPSYKMFEPELKI